ncbi:MAG: hypothetical protein ACWA5A_13405 [Marinibacterium sp.]
MSPKMCERLRLISQGLERNSFVRFKHRGRTYIFMDGRWWIAPKI